MKNKMFFLMALILLTCFVCCGCNNSKYVTRTEYALGTIVSVKVRGLNENIANAAIDKAFERLFDIERLSSAKRPESELSYVNQNAFERDVVISDELFFLVKSGLFYSELTNGSFDITLGGVVELWGIGTDNARVPSSEEIEIALGDCGFEYLVMDKETNTVRFLKSGLKIDLGGIAKGYAADEMKRVLLESGVKTALLDLGGNIMVIGDNSGSPWTIGVTDPLEPGNICAMLRITDKTVVTSGNYERYFTYEGKNYHHIFDRNTGFPAESGLISATVIADNSMDADALSTAFFVMGAEKAAALANSALTGTDYILIDRNMNFTHSENIELEIIK